VDDYLVPGVNIMRCIAYHPPFAVSPFLLTLLLFHCQGTLWPCGQLRPYVEIGSLGAGLHWDCNVMGDTATISPRVPSTCPQYPILYSLIIHILSSLQIYVGIDKP